MTSCLYPLARWGVAFVLGVIGSVNSFSASPSQQEQVFAVECAFARSMAERDLKAFTRFLLPQAIFFGSTKTLCFG